MRLVVALVLVLGTSLTSPRARAADWARESDRVLAAARQHVGQHPYGYADGGSRSGYSPQLMFAAPPYVSSSIDGMDCVGFVYVVFSETGHGGRAAATNRVVDVRRDVYWMHDNYQDGYGRTTFDDALLNEATSMVNDATAKPGDILIFKTNDGKPPSSTNLKHVAIYSGSSHVIHMTSTAVLETGVSPIYDLNGHPYVMAAVVHTHLYENADHSPYPPVANTLPAAPIVEAQAVFDVTGHFTDNLTGATYHPAAANTDGRLLDSRYSKGVYGHFQAQKPQTFLVAGYGNVPSHAVAVTGNVTVTNQTERGYVTIAPGRTLQADVAPDTSTINFPVGENRANTVSVALSSDGCLDAVYFAPKGESTDIIFDVTGYYTDDATGATYHALGTTTGGRVLDSRAGVGVDGALVSKQPRTFRVAMFPGSPYGPSAVPADAVAVTGNVTVTGAKAAGYVTIAPAGSFTSAQPPAISTINFPAGDTRANGVTVGLADGSLDAVYWAATGATTHVIFDVTGYYTSDSSGATYHPRLTTANARVLDSRIGLGVLAPFHAREPMSFQVTQYPGDPYSYGDVPPGAVAVTGNLTIVNQACKGFATIAPADTLAAEVAPDTSTINFPVGDTRANGVTVGLSPGGRLDLVYWWKPPESPKLGTDPCQ